jgi:cold shock CspA family protein
MRGSITRLLRKQGCGFILGEDGCEVYFDRSALNGSDIAGLSVGQWVEYELQYGFERLRGTNIKILRGEAADDTERFRTGAEGKNS